MDFGGMSDDEFFLGHDAFLRDEYEEDNNEEDYEDLSQEERTCANCANRNDKGWCDVVGDYCDIAYNGCEHFVG